MRTSAALLAAAVFASPARCAAPPVIDEPLAALVARLGHDDFDARQRADASLLRRDDAIPALRQATRHEDAEIRHRASRLLPQVQTKVIAARLATGDWEDAVSILLRGGSQDSDLGLRELREFARELRDDASRGKLQFLSRRWAGLDVLDFKVFAAKHRRDRYFSSGKLIWSSRRGESATGGIVRAGELHSSVDWLYSLVVVEGTIHQQSKGSNHDCLIVSSESVQLGGTDGSLILCGGSVTATSPYDCLVIARGDVTLKHLSGTNVIICGGKITYARDTSRKLVKDVPHKYVSFFDVKRIGVEVEASDAGVKVKAAPHGGCFSRGGVRPGDVVTAVAGEKVADTEALRRLILPHAAEQATVAVTLLRDGRRIVANVPLRP